MLTGDDGLPSVGTGLDRRSMRGKTALKAFDITSAR